MPGTEDVMAESREEPVAEEKTEQGETTTAQSEEDEDRDYRVFVDTGGSVRTGNWRLWV